MIKFINKLKQNILQHILESKQVRRICYLIRLFQMIAPLYDKLRFLKLVFGCGMKTLFLPCRKLYLLLENEEMVER